MIKTDNFTGSKREKSNIAVTLLVELTNLRALKFVSPLGALIVFLPTVQYTALFIHNYI